MNSKIEYFSLPVIFSNTTSSTKYLNIKRKCFLRYKRILIGSLCLSVFYLITHLYIVRDLLYFLRPLYDHETEFTRISHFYDSSINTSQLCEIHGWKSRLQKKRVIDIVIFSIEFDILELRLHELWDSVDLFIVIEADRTFSGNIKPLWLEHNLKNSEQFRWAKKKLKHHALVNVLQELSPGESPFKNENLQRSSVTNIISQYLKDGDLVILSDVDEIPRSSTVDLIRSCDQIPDPLHLELQTFYYSFEFFFSSNYSWRSKIQTYNRKSFSYNHSQKSKFLFSNSGWHCTFCFRFLHDFRFKMQFYSHNDRLMNRKNLLENHEIQTRICSGLDVFDMWPEVYTWREMLQKFGPIQSSKSYVDLPRGLLLNHSRFRYLLPGNCIREDYNNNKTM